MSDRGRQGRERRKEREVIEDAARPPERKPEWNPGGGLKETVGLRAMNARGLFWVLGHGCVTA